MPFDETSQPTSSEPEYPPGAEIPASTEQLGSAAVNEGAVHIPIDESQPLTNEEPESTPAKSENSGEFVGDRVVFRIDREVLRKNANADEVFIAERIAALPEQIEFHPGIQLLVGPNGSGKSTLLSAMFYRAEEQYLGGKPEVSDSEFMRTAFRRDTAEAVHLDQASQFDVAIYFDGAESDPFVKKAMRKQAELGPDMEKQILNKMFATQRKESSRESKDAVFDQLSRLLRKLHDDGKRALLFIDEFENGLDPRRHLRAKEILQDLIGPQDVAIIATNSPILFSEDLPRLDFTFPEKGMHGSQESVNASNEEVEKRLDYYRFTKDIERYIRTMSRMFSKKPDEWSEQVRRTLEPLAKSPSFEQAMKDRGVNCKIRPEEGASHKLQSLSQGEALDLFDVKIERSNPFAGVARDSADRYFSIGKISAQVDDQNNRSVGLRVNSTDEIEEGFQEAATRKSIDS